MFFLEALQKEDTGLFAFNQEDGSVFVIDFGLGGDGGTNDDFIEIGLSQSVFGDIELDVDPEELRELGRSREHSAFREKRLSGKCAERQTEELLPEVLLQELCFRFLPFLILYR